MTTEFQENAIGVRIEIEFVDETGTRASRQAVC